MLAQAAAQCSESAPYSLGCVTSAEFFCAAAVLVKQRGHSGDSGVCSPTDFKDLKFFQFVTVSAFPGAASKEQRVVVPPGCPSPQQQPALQESTGLLFS